MNKDFYRSFIYKIFSKGPSTPIQLKKNNHSSQHSSISQSKRAAFTTTRKNLSTTMSSLQSKMPSSKTISNTLHVTTRNSSLELKKSNQTYRLQKSLNASPYKPKVRDNKQSTSKGKSIHRQYKK